jgi:hypothetical protein
MIDSTTKEPIRVRTEDPLRPYLVVPDSQLDQVSAVLTSNGVRFSIDNLRFSFSGRPPVAYVKIARGTDPNQIQALLDTAS